MGHQALSEKSRRRLARAIEQDIVWASATHDHWLCFTTTDHRHGAYLPRTQEIVWDEPGRVVHGTSCDVFFPDYRKEQS
jgi:hypothetical protein